MARKTTQTDGAVAVTTPRKARPSRPSTAKPARPKKPAAKAKNTAPSKAERVRALLEEGKSVLDISKALDDVSWAYAWDVAAAWERKTGRTVIASHAKGGAK